jgi:hypothetical protein
MKSKGERGKCSDKLQSMRKESSENDDEKKVSKASERIKEII